MLLIDISLSLLDLVAGIERVLLGLDSFREWRRSQSDARIRGALTNLAPTKTA
jgi:hypothetical protein